MSQDDKHQTGSGEARRCGPKRAGSLPDPCIERDGGDRGGGGAGGGVGLSHVDAHGRANMVDVSGKDVTTRQATASARVHVQPDVLTALIGGALPKGEALGTARIAGICAAKRTGDWIPLCHPLPLDWARVDFARTGPGELLIVCTAKTTARTGVEMEALVGASAAALTIYDMAKAVDKSIEIGPVRLEHKSGGRSGTYRRAEG